MKQIQLDSPIHLSFQIFKHLICPSCCPFRQTDNSRVPVPPFISNYGAKVVELALQTCDSRSIPKKSLIATLTSLVICGDLKFSENRTDIITNPILMVEVLSPSTALEDRNAKLDEYSDLKSVQVRNICLFQLMRQKLSVSSDTNQVNGYIHPSKV
jgi:hypothetical protein